MSTHDRNTNKLWLFAVALISLLSLIILIQNTGKPHPHAVTTQVKVLKPHCGDTVCSGSMAYRSGADGGVWWYYSYSYPVGSPPPRSSVPPMGKWSKAKEEPKEEDVEEEGSVEMMEADGTPMTAEEFEAAVEAEAADTSTDSTGSTAGVSETTAAVTTESSSTSSGSTDSSSSGGGDGGSDGGGGGGGD